MKTAITILRGSIFIIICYFFMFFAFAGYSEYTDWIIQWLGKIQHSMPQWLFWVLFFLIGVVMLQLSWAIVKFVVIALLLILARISPTHKFTLWVVGLCAANFCIPFVVERCQNAQGWFQWAVTFVVCGTAIYLAYSFVHFLNLYEDERRHEKEMKDQIISDLKNKYPNIDLDS